MTYLKYFLVILLSVFSLTSIAQKKIEYKADLGMRHPSLPDTWILVNNVTFKHEGMILDADSALYDEVNNRFDAFNNVAINVNDTMFIYGDILHYEGTSKLAEMQGDVKLIDDSVILKTNSLQYDRGEEIAFYPYWGHTNDGKNDLYSKQGYYHKKTKDFFFRRDVVLINESGKVLSDTMLYNTNTDIAFFMGPTHVYNKENYIYTENGWYNTKTEQTQSLKNSFLKNEQQTITGDNIYYDKTIKLGIIRGNAEILDSTNNVIIQGDYAKTDGIKNYSFVTGKATALFIDENDTLFLHSDTISALNDTLQKIEHVFAYYNAKFYRHDLQGMCDSIYYSVADSLIEMYRDPFVWTGRNQFLADTIKIETGEKGIKKAYFNLNAFVVSISDSTQLEQFDQLKGRYMIGYFNREKELDWVDVNGNAEFLYYIREDEPDKTQSLIGINVGFSSDMKILFEENSPSVIKAMKTPTMTTYPEEQLTGETRYLKKFKWLEEKRPQSKEDIYQK